jgi:dTMP kinase
MSQGLLLNIEGPDGSGKTSLCAELAHAIREAGAFSEVLEIREPGSCALGDLARGILKGESHLGALTDDRAEALLFAAARAELTASVIRPALERGACVISDRGIGSSLIYQGLARGLDVDTIRAISMFATDDLKVDRVLALVVSVEVARERMGRRDGMARDRIEDSVGAGVLREGYERLRDLSPHEVVEIDAEGTPDEVLALCLAAISDLLPPSAG